MGYKIKDLKKLPVREWDKNSEYESILVINSGYNHESGFKKMLIIGIINEFAVEIASNCSDVISWEIKGDYNLRTDMYKNGVVRFWSWRNKFKVSPALSSITITVG